MRPRPPERARTPALSPSYATEKQLRCVRSRHAPHAIASKAKDPSRGRTLLQQVTPNKRSQRGAMRHTQIVSVARLGHLSPKPKHDPHKTSIMSPRREIVPNQVDQIRPTCNHLWNLALDGMFCCGMIEVVPSKGFEVDPRRAVLGSPLA